MFITCHAMSVIWRYGLPDWSIPTLHCPVPALPVFYVESGPSMYFFRPISVNQPLSVPHLQGWH